MKAAIVLFLGLIPFCAAAEPATPVVVRPAGELLFYPEYSAPAEVVPLNDARLSAEISARIEQIAVRVGDRVDAGDALVTLDCRDYRSRAEAQQATRIALETRLRLARTQVRRARDLKRASNISDEEVDRRETELQALEAELAAQKELEVQARNDTARCTIQAPFTGVVSERLASVGALAAPGTPLLRLVQTDQSEVSARVRPSEVEAGAGAQSLRFTYLNESYPLRLLRVSPVVDPATRTVEVRLGFTGTAAPPGASGRIHWRGAVPHLPADIPLRRDGTLGVFLFNDGHARFHPLPEAREGRPAPVDLAADARIVTEGRHGLREGAALAPRDAAATR